MAGATLTFIYEIGYGPFPAPWQGAQPTTASGRQMANRPERLRLRALLGARPRLHTITASSDGISASRPLIQADHLDDPTGHLHSPFEAVGAGWAMPAMPSKLGAIPIHADDVRLMFARRSDERLRHRSIPRRSG